VSGKFPGLTDNRAASGLLFKERRQWATIFAAIVFTTA